MDLPRPALVKQLKLHLSSEGRGFTYLLADMASGKILRLSRQAALAYERFATAVAGAAKGGDAPVEADARSGIQALAMIRNLRDGDRFPNRRFNPLMMGFPLFELAPFQPFFAGFARATFGVPGAVLAAIIAIVAILFGIRNDWAIVSEFNDIFSLQALITFGLISPVLKGIHEFGHFLAATRYGVRLRKAGVNVIGLFPVPYVDCSDADLSAARGARMMISGAGILTDLVIGAALMIAWHLVQNGFWQLVIGRAFVFNTLNSVLFNANPLMRADGYFILADAIGRRNLGTEAQLELKRARMQVLGRPVASRDWALGQLALVGYAIAALIYRIWLTITILWGILPRYLGLGLAIGAWGALAMAQTQFAAMSAARLAQPPQTALPQPRFGYRHRLAALGVVAVAILFVPVAPVAVVDVNPDISAAHAVTVQRGGTVVSMPQPAATVIAGQPLVTLQSGEAANALTIAQMQLVEAEVTAQAAKAAGAAGDQMGLGRLETAQTKLALAEKDVALLVLRAPAAGQFSLFRPLRTGQYLAAGSTIGQLLPQGSPIILGGTFPETRVTAFERGVTDVTLWDGQSYRDLDPKTASLAEQVRVNQTDLIRGLTLRIALPAGQPLPASNAVQVRLRFTAVPVWQHIADWGRNIIGRFRDAEIAERQQRIENP